MKRRRGRSGSLFANPVLVGAATTLITVVTVFLAYNANSGLPFVPTYQLKAKIPNANNLVLGNEVRMGGARVGVVDAITPVQVPDGSVHAELSLKLETGVRPLPSDSTLMIRPRSVLGLKYVEIQKGSSSSGFADGATMPVANARPKPVELDEFLNTFDERTRDAQQRNLRGYGDALAGRGRSLNETIAYLRPLLPSLESVTKTLAARSTRLDRLWAELGDGAAEAAPVAEEQGQLFVGLDRTFTAFADVARPYIQQAIERGPAALDQAIRSLPRQRPFLRNATGFFAELRPGASALREAAKPLADSAEIGAPALRASVGLNRGLEALFQTLERFSSDPFVPIGIRTITQTTKALGPMVAHLAPAQATCNYMALLFRNVASTFSRGDANGNWLNFMIVVPPVARNSQGGPSSAPADGPDKLNHLRSNPYPNVGAPGQPKECEAGNEPFDENRTVIGNTAGIQSNKTEPTGKNAP